MRILLALLLLNLALPLCATPKSRGYLRHTMSRNVPLKQIPFQTETLDEYTQHRITRETLIRRLIAGKLVVLAHAPRLEGRQINIQDYIWQDKPYIAVFSDILTARRLLTGATAKPGMTLWQIQGRLLFDLFQNNEWVIINAGAANMVEFHAGELRPYLHEASSGPEPTK